MASPTLTFALLLAAVTIGHANANLVTKRFRLRRAAGTNATVFSHVYNIRMAHCDDCAADVVPPTASLLEARGEAAQQQLYEHTLEGEKQMVFTHRINIPPQACACANGDNLQALLSRLEALEAQVAAFRDQCPGGTCCASAQAGKGQTDIQGLCSRHGNFDLGKCRCVCEKGWGGSTCSEPSCPNSCSDHGECVDGECLCQEGFTGEGCELTTCEEDCNDQGRCIRGKCVCFPGYTGPACGEPSCPENCKGHGLCVKEACVCDPGFTGPDCGSRACPENCRDRGKCLDGTCMCNTGFSGLDCGTRSCPQNCRNRGKCIDGKCFCNPGYAGTDCASRSCPENCKNRGKCVNGKCVCNPGFAGPACGARSCPENCHNHGQCINGKCVCNPGYTGPSCSSRSCPENCSGRGQCQDGKCVCSEGFTGPNCGSRTCPENCRDRGRCEDGHCVCEEGFTGPNCGSRTCPENCRNRGQCQDGRCICEEGFTGPNCGTKMCPENCRNRGQCQDGHCICEEGFTGPNCGTKTCPENCRNRGQCQDGRCVCEEGFTGPNCGSRTCPENCNNQGQCQDGHCICEEGFNGPNCGTKTCPENCRNQGKCQDGRCICEKGFSGDNCGTKTCPENCRNRGQCQDGRCVCEEGFTGPNCGSRTCPENCRNRGQCQDGRCVCEEGFTGDNCGTRTCPDNCRDRGQCEDGRCICDEGFTGDNCGTKTCPENCRNRGQCQDGHCVCEEGFTGPTCGTKTCPENCRNQGQCQDGRCICEEGFTGPNCGTKTCPDNCKSHGQCVDGLCVCSTGYTGPNCGTKNCPNNCNNKGRCENGKCICQEGYAGPICGLKVCPNNCSNRGRCQKGTCICRRGYTGPDCGETSCPNQCQGRGRCMEGRCECLAGFAGADCSEKTCSNSCSQQGRCEAGKCVCQEGFTGEDCSTAVPAVEGLQLRAREETSVIVEWERPQTPVDAFEISFRPTKEDNGVLSNRLRSTITAFNQTGLAPGEEYLVTIRAQKDKTLGPETTRTIMTRLDGPKNLRATGVTQTAVTLQWESPAAHVDHYLVTYMSPVGAPHQEVVPAGKEVVSLTELDSGAKYTFAVTAARGGETSAPASTTTTTAAADAASRPGRQSLPVGGVEASAPWHSPMLKKPSPSAQTPKVQVTPRGMVEKPPPNVSVFTKEESVVTTVITGEPQKMVHLSRLPSVAEEDTVVTTMLAGGGPQKVEPTKRWPSLTKGEKVVRMGATTEKPPSVEPPKARSVIIKTGKVVTTVITKHSRKVVSKDKNRLLAKEKNMFRTGAITEEPPSVGPTKARSAIIKKGKLVTTVITRGSEEVELTDEKSALTKEERVETTFTAGEELPHVETTSRRPIKVLTTGGTLPPTKEDRAVKTVIISEGPQKVGSSNGSHTHVTEEVVVTTSITEELHPEGTSGNTSSVTGDERVITTVLTKEGANKVVSTHGRSPLTKEENVVATILKNEQLPKAMATTKEPQRVKKEQVFKTVTTREGDRKVELTDKRSQVTREEEAVLTVITGTGKALSPTKKPPLRVPVVIPREGSLKGAAPDKRPLHTKKEKEVTSGLTGEESQTEAPVHQKPPLPKQGKVLVTTKAPKRADAGRAPDKKPLATEERELTTAVPGKRRQKTVSPDKSLLLTTKERSGVSLITEEVSQGMTPPGKRPSHTSEEKVMTPTLPREGPSSVARKPPVSKKEGVVTGVSTLEERHKFGPAGKRPGAAEDRVVMPTGAGPTRDGKTAPTEKSVVTTATKKADKKVMVSDKSPPFGKEEKTKIVAKEELQKGASGGKKPFSVDEDATAGKHSKPVKNILGRGGATASRIVKEHGNWTPTAGVKTKLLTTTDLLLEKVIQNISAKLSPFNGTLLQQLESYLRATAYPLRENQTIKTIAKAIFLYLVSKKPLSVREKLYDRLAEMTPVAVTKPLPRPTRPSDTLKVQGGTAVSSQLPERDPEPDEDKREEEKTPGQRRNKADGQHGPRPTLEPLKETRATLRPISMTREESDRARELLRVEEKISSGTTTDLTKHARPQVISRTSTSIVVSLDGLKGHSKSVVVSYQDIRGDTPSHRLDFPGDTSLAEILGLSPGTTYRIDLHGVFKGHSSKSYSIVTSTAPDPGQSSMASKEPPTPRASTHVTQSPSRDPAARPPTSTAPTLSGSLGDLSVTVASDSLVISWRAEPRAFDNFTIRYRDPAAPGPKELHVPGDQRTTRLTFLRPGTEYEIQLHGVVDGRRTTPIMTKATTAPRKPPVQPSLLGGLAVQDVEVDRFRLVWKASKGVFDSFLVRYEDAEGQLGPQETSVSGDLRATVIRNLDAGSKYTVSLYGVRKGQLSRALKTTVTTVSTEGEGIMARVEGLFASDIRRDSVLLSWTVQDGDFDFFLIQYSDAGGKTRNQTVRGDRTTATIPGLLPSTNYTFNLYGISDDKRTKPVAVDVTTAQPPPRFENFLASDVTRDSLRLSWSVHEGEFDSFLIQYRDSQGRSQKLPIDAGTRTVNVSGLRPAQTYTFDLYGVSNNEQSEPVSIVAKTAPENAVPRLVNLSISNVSRDSLRLSWTVQGGDFDSFLIQYRDAEGRPQELPVDGDLGGATILGLKPSKKYKFSVSGVFGGRRAKPVSTEVITAAKEPPRLGDLSVSDVSPDSLRLSWTIQDGDFDSFLIQYRDAQGSPQELPVQGNVRTTTISGLKPLKKYKFLLHGVFGAKRTKPVSAEATTAPPPKKPLTRLPRLGNLSVSDVQKDSLQLSWMVEFGDFDSFLIRYKDSQGAPQELAVGGSLRAATVTSLKPSEKYKFELYGVSGNQQAQPLSVEAITAALATPPTVPPELGELSVSNITRDSLRLSWTLRGGGFDSFLILYRDAKGKPRGLPVRGDLRSFQISGLAPSTKYQFLLYGRSRTSHSDPLSADATTGPEKPVSPLPTLGDLSVSDIAEDSLQISWTIRGGDFDSFLIQYRDVEGNPQELKVDGDQNTVTVSGLAPSQTYTFHLQGKVGTESVGPKAIVATTGRDPPQLPKLGDLSTSDVTEDSARLSWIAQDGSFDSFLIRYRDSEGQWQEVPVDGDKHDTTISGLRPSKKYTFILYGVFEGERTEPRSTEVTTTAVKKVMAKPAVLGQLSISDIGKDSLRLSWTVQTGDFDRFVIQYRNPKGDLEELRVDGSSRMADITGLRPSRKYKFNLYGVAKDKRSKAVSAEATTAPPETSVTEPHRPGPLAVSDITKDSLQLSWTAPDGAFDSFFIQYRDAAGTVRELTVDGGFRTARIVGLKPSKKYKFSLYGVSGDRRTKPVAAEATTASPDKPLGRSPHLGEFFASDVGKESLQLAWTVEDGEFDSFVIQYRDAEGQDQQLAVEGDHHAATVSGLLPSREYKFTLYGISQNRRSKPVSTKATTVFPEAIGQRAALLDDLYISEVGTDSVHLSWDASERAFDSFLIQYMPTSGEAPLQEMVVAGDGRTTPIRGLQPNTEYNFTLYGLQRRQKMADLNTIGRTSRLDLDLPRDLHFRNIQETSVLVSWLPPPMAVDTFKVSFQLADGGEPESFMVDGKTSTIPLTGLTPGARYEVNVMSIRGFEESEPLTGYVATVPDGPTDLRAVNVTESSALLLWRPALAAVDQYIITYSAQTVPAVTKTLSGNNAELPLEGLKVDTEYTARIYATKGANSSTPAVTTFTTSADAPRDLIASQVSPRTAVLSWTPPQAVPTGYVLTYEAPSGETKEIQLGAAVNSYRLTELIPLSQYRARLQAMRGRVRTAPTSTVFTTARLRYPFPRDCAEERMNGATRSQPETVYLNGDRGRPVKVFCDMETDGGGWMVFQRRMNGKTNFWRNWEDYAKGFGNLTQEFWLGNEKLHKFTSQGTYELRVDLRTKNESAYAVYDSFRVDTQASYYRLRLGRYSGTAGDSLSYHNNMIFSTRDRDRNKHIMPCAISYRGAWWYKNCHYVNLNGLYGNNKDHQGVNWYNWKGFEFSIPFTEMKMRPKNNAVALRRI